MRSGTRLGAALLGASVALLLSVLPATAEEPVLGDIVNLPDESGLSVNLVGAGHAFSTSLIGLKLPGGAKLKTYCIEIDRVIPEHPPQMGEAPWGAFPDDTSPFRKNNAKINWLLHNSYPFFGMDKLSEELAKNGVKIEGTLSKDEAIAGTQAATWHFSDDKDLAENNPANVKAVYNFLIGDKNIGLAQPVRTLDITPNSAGGAIGTRIGPFKVTTTATEITKLTPKVPAGVTITDKDGKELAASAIKNGTEIFMSVPATATPGNGTFDIEATVPVSTGRVFVSKGSRSQGLIVAQSEATKLTASVLASWTAAATAPTTTTTPPAPQASNGALANTGVSIFVPISLGVLLLAAGAGALLFLRRRARA